MMISNKKIILTLIVLGVIALIFVVLIIYPFFNEIKKNSAELIKQKEKLASFSQEKENLKQIEVLYKNYQSNLEKIKEVLVDPEVPIEFISFIEQIAKDSEVSIKISSISSVKAKADPWPSIAFQISATSSSPNFLKFLEKLENSPWLINILKLDIKKLIIEGETSSEGDIKAVFSIKVFTK